MSTWATAVTRVPLPEARIRRLQARALVLSVLGTIGVGAFALSDSEVLRWPAVAVIAVLLVGLAAGPVVRRSSGRSTHTAVLTTALGTALVVAILGLSTTALTAGIEKLTWPEWVMAAVLGAGLAVGPALRILARDPTVPRPEQAIASVVAMAIFVYELVAWDIGSRPTVLAVLAVLGVGLVSEPVVSRLGSGSVSCNGAAAIAALLVLAVFLPSYVYGSYLPADVAAGVLTAGLIIRPGARMLRGEPAHRHAPSIAAALAVCVAVIALTEFDASPRWAVVAVATMLGAGLIAVLVSQQARERPVVTVACAGGVVVLLVGVADAFYLASLWPEWTITAILVAGLGAATLSRLADDPRERALSERVEELSRTRTGALDVQATELRRIERDLHDGAQARLVALSMKLGRAESRFDGDDEIAALLREAREDAAAAIRELRELARGIAPPVLTDRGLGAAVESLAQRTGSDVRVIGTLTDRQPPAVEVAAYFVVAESLTNAVKHAPGAAVEVRLDERGGDLFVEITDFGPGGADPSGGGLTGLRQRVEALDGALHVTSPAGVGTQVEAVLPCAR